MSDTWKIKIKASAKGDLKKVLRSPLRPAFEKIKSVLETDPYKPIQSFEKLTPPAAGYYSRRINNQHRVVYTIDQKRRLVTIFSCWAHYQNTLKTAGKTKNRKNQ